jgi:hypothetical protein
MGMNVLLINMLLVTLVNVPVDGFHHVIGLEISLHPLDDPQSG